MLRLQFLSFQLCSVRGAQRNTDRGTHEESQFRSEHRAVDESELFNRVWFPAQTDLAAQLCSVFDS